MSLFDRWANKLVEATRGDRIDPASVWIGLSTTVPKQDGTNWNEVTEAGYGGYARVSLAGLMSSAAGGLTLNNTLISFPVPRTGGGIVAAVGLFSHPTDGPAVAGRMFAALTPGVLIVAGRQPEIGASALTLSSS